MELVTALASMKAGIELATIALEARDDRKVREAISEISARLADANMDALAMSTTLRNIDAQLGEATAKLAATQERLRKREKYVLRAIAEGVFVYAYEPFGDDPTPVHYQCQVCFDRGENSILCKAINGTRWNCKIDKSHSLEIAALQFSGRSAQGWER